MCCESTETLGLPPEVIEALARYRRLLAERGADWGDEQVEFSRWARCSLVGPVFEAFLATGDWGQAIRSVIGRVVPAGIVVVRVDAGRRLRAEVGPARVGIAGRRVRLDVVIDSAADAELALTVAGQEVRVAARGATVETIDVDGAAAAFPVVLGDQLIQVTGAVRTAAGAELRLRSPRCARWSVTDASGGGWFPDGVLAKWDVHDRPFFHGHDLTLAVPAVPLLVACARGIEFDRTELQVVPAAGQTRVVDADPPRLFDPAATGWYGGDLHIHMNYSGDLVCTPSDAARMQQGEGLHLANFLAANFQTSLVYARELLAAFPDTDLPCSDGDTVARMGVEYRNDLLGHVHALGLREPPTRYYAGHARSDHPQDLAPERGRLPGAAQSRRDRGLRPPSVHRVPGGLVYRALSPGSARGGGA